MKKLLVTLAAVLVSASVMGQGLVSFNNRTGTGDAPVSRPDGTGAGAGAIAQLYLVGAGGSLTALTPQTTFRGPSPAAAFFVNPVDVAVTGVQPGNSATLRMRAWEGAAGSSYEAAVLKGESNDVLVPSLGGIPPTGGAPIPTPQLNGLQAFQMVPEPSTIALGVLGAAALLLRRRK